MGETRDGLVDERLMLRPDLGALISVDGAPAVLAPDQLNTRIAGAPVKSAFALRLPRVRSQLAELAELEAARGTLFNLLPVFMGFGAILYFTMASEPAFSPIALMLLITVIASLLADDRPFMRNLFIAAAAIAAGLMFAKIETLSRQTILLGEQITTRVTGRVLSMEATPRGHRAVIEVLSTERPQLKYQPSRIKVTLRKTADGLKPGDGVKALFLLRPPSGPVRPGSFDFAFDSYFDRVGANGISLSDIERVDAAAPGAGRRLLFWFERQRVAIAARIRAQISGQSGEMSAALITGLAGGIDAQTNDAMRVSGLAHVTSISGLHMALVAGSVMGSIRLLLALFPQFASRYPIKKCAAGLALAGALIYLLLSGGGVATIRSFIMLAIMLIAALFDRAAITMRNLVIAAIIILAFAPHEIMGPSFQMSFAATAALIACYQVYSEWRWKRAVSYQANHSLMRRSWRAGSVFVLGILATSLVAGLATAVFSAFHFNRIAPLGLAANLIAMPVVSVIVMPMALLSVLLMPFGLEAGPLWLMGKGVDFMLGVADWIAGMSAAGDSGAVPVPALLLFTLSILTFCLLNTKLRLAAIPVAALALGCVFIRTVPDIAVAEDAKLVAVRGSGNALILNQTRPNRFTLDNWQRAYKAAAMEGGAMSFGCGAGLCTAKNDAGIRVGHLTDKTRFEEACQTVDLLIAAAPLEKDRCAGNGAFVITARQLARRGAAEVRIEPGAGGRPRFSVTYSIASLERPWQRHRQFSRAARNMEPYVSKKKAAPQPPAAPSGLDATVRAD
jgi:ComEC/Rec2-related protein